MYSQGQLIVASSAWFVCGPSVFPVAWLSVGYGLGDEQPDTFLRETKIEYSKLLAYWHWQGVLASLVCLLGGVTMFSVPSFGECWGCE